MSSGIPEIKIPGAAGKIPIGCIPGAKGEKLYVDPNGNNLTKEQYIAKYGVDPEELWKKVQEYRAQGKPTVKIGKS